MIYRPLDDWVAEQRRHGDVRTYWRGCRCGPCKVAHAEHRPSLEPTARDIAVLYAIAKARPQSTRRLAS